MSDNIFDRLMELLQSPGPVNWKLAAEVTGSLAGADTTVMPGLVVEYEQLVHLAQLHIEPVASFPLLNPQLHVVERAGWAKDNLKSFAYLAEPLAAKLGGAAGGGAMEQVMAPLGPVILGMQVGAMVGFMSHRVLGQFDVGLPPLGADGLYLVAPNIEDFASDHQIDPPQARLWAALHEVAFNGVMSVSWIRPHLNSLIEDYFEGVEFDPSSLLSRFEGLDDPEELERLMADPGVISSIVSGPGQEEALGKIRAMTALVDGYADWMMQRVAPDLIPDAPRLAESINRRRAEPSQGEEFLARFAGLELKRLEYRLGADFCRDVYERWGDEGLATLLGEPENLPTIPELEDPIGWAARVLLDRIGSE